MDLDVKSASIIMPSRRVCGKWRKLLEDEEKIESTLRNAIVFYLYSYSSFLDKIRGNACNILTNSYFYLPNRKLIEVVRFKKNEKDANIKFTQPYDFKQKLVISSNIFSDFRSLKLLWIIGVYLHTERHREVLLV